MLRDHAIRPLSNSECFEFELAGEELPVFEQLLGWLQIGRFLKGDA